MSEKVRISSSWTYVTKYFLPWVWIGLIGYLFYLQYRLENWGNVLLVVFAGVFVLYLGVYLNISLKEVFLDDQYLYISDFNKEIRVSRSKIERVTEWNLNRSRQVWIYFTEETEFGKKVVFMPTFQSGLFFAVHPIVEELKKKVN